MSFDEFRAAAVSGSAVPAGLTPALTALWLDAKGNWDGAHAAAQADGGREAAWVHAYLHRKEGDLGNAGYWYRRAGQTVPAPELMLADEWTAIARALLAR